MSITLPMSPISLYNIHRYLIVYALLKILRLAKTIEITIINTLSYDQSRDASNKLTAPITSPSLQQSATHARKYANILLLC